MSTVLLDGLESRVLMTILQSEPTPKPMVDPAVLEADRAQISTDVAKMEADLKASNAALAAARAARDTNKKASDAALKNLTTQKYNDEKAMKAALAANDKALATLRAKWAPITGPLEKDVKTDSEGESAEERASDAARLAAFRVQLMSEYTAIATKAKSDRAAYTEKLAADKAAIDQAKAYVLEKGKADIAAVSAAELTLRNVFNTDRLIVLADFATYRSHGGNVDALKIKLPTIDANRK